MILPTQDIPECVVTDREPGVTDGEEFVQPLPGT